MRAIDLFAGWGGFTLGAQQAGIEVVWAANHWPIAVAAHAANHPTTEHSCQDLRQADWSKLPEFEVLLAAPACQGHSTAAQPRRRRYHDALRATAWAVVDCADVTEPEAIIVENVPSFQRWRLFPLWRSALERIGYRVQGVELVATDFGVPQRRRRLFVVCTRSGVDLMFGGAVTEPSFGPCIDWNDRGWRPVTAAADGARQRIEDGQRRCGPRFLSQHVTGHRGVPLEEPIRTITCQDQWIVVDGDRYRPLTVRETARAMGFPDSYAWPSGVSRSDAIRGLGNAVVPAVAANLLDRVIN